MKASGGGITCSGGEAMLQPEFVRDFSAQLKLKRIHTSSWYFNGYIRKHTEVIDEVLEASDSVMLDLKHMRDEIHHDFIGVSNRRTLDFARYLHKIGKKTWIRYVIVPGYTDTPEDAHLSWWVHQRHG